MRWCGSGSIWEISAAKAGLKRWPKERRSPSATTRTISEGGGEVKDRCGRRCCRNGMGGAPKRGRLGLSQPRCCCACHCDKSLASLSRNAETCIKKGRLIGWWLAEEDEGSQASEERRSPHTASFRSLFRHATAACARASERSLQAAGSRAVLPGIRHLGQYFSLHRFTPVGVSFSGRGRAFLCSI